MAIQILATKLYAPLPPHKVVSRPRLIGRLVEGLIEGRKLTVISAPAGFGKTTLISEWVAHEGNSAAWLSLDESDSSPVYFLAYCIHALQTITPNIGSKILKELQSSQPPSAEATLTSLLNEIVSTPKDFILVLDDYHLIDSRSVDEALSFLVNHLPPRMHLVITTREDPALPPSCAPRTCALRLPKRPNFSMRSWDSILRRKRSLPWKNAPKAGSPVCN